MRGESIALVVLAVVLVLFGGGLARRRCSRCAAALATIAGSLLALNALASATAVSEFAVNVVTLLGLGLAVDYSLLVIARFREERAADPEAALADLLARTVAGAGRAVLVSGLAVGIALAALYVFADPLLSAMALGGALAVGTATLAGPDARPRADRYRAPAHPGAGHAHVGVAARPNAGPGLLARLAAFAQRRPAPVALTVTAALVALCVPAFGLDVANSDARSLPASAEERRVQESRRARLHHRLGRPDDRARSSAPQDQALPGGASTRSAT